MVDALIAVGVYLPYNSVANKLRQIEILLGSNTGKIVSVLAVNEPSVHFRQVGRQNVLYKELVLLGVGVFKFDLVHFLRLLEPQTGCGPFISSARW